jgi:hypothetical protein
MKHLLNGVAIAAALAIAAPAWSQTPATPSPKTAAAPMAPMAPMQRHKRVPMHHMTKGSGNQMTDQLNHEELTRLQGGGAVVPPPPAGYAGQPSPTMGIPGGGQPSASSHASPQSPMPPR